MNASAILIGQHNNLRFAGHDCIYLGFLHVAVRSEYYPTTRRDLLDPDTIISVIIEMNCMKRAARYLELANRIAALTSPHARRARGIVDPQELASERCWRSWNKSWPHRRTDGMMDSFWDFS